MKLIKEQINLLELEKDQLTKKIQDIKNSIKNMDSHASLFGSHDGTLLELKKQIVTFETRKREIENILERSEIVDYFPTEKIDIGSHIELFIDYGDNTDFQDENYLEIILIEEKVGQESYSDYITTKSNIGQAIFGKKAGEKFSYLDNTSQEIKGIIMSVNSLKEKEKIAIKKKGENES